MSYYPNAEAELADTDELLNEAKETIAALTKQLAESSSVVAALTEQRDAARKELSGAKLLLQRCFDDMPCDVTEGTEQWRARRVSIAARVGSIEAAIAQGEPKE